MSRTISRPGLLLLAMMVCSGPGWSNGQVLQIPKPVTTGGEQVSLEGTVLETKKYSFVVESQGTRHTIEMPRHVKPSLRLHKPNFDLEHNRVTVEPMSAGQSNPANGGKRKVYELEEKLFIQVRFEHERQKNRIMSANTKRLNNYRISSRPSPDKNGKMMVSGQIRLAEDRATIQLLQPDGTADPVILGHQNARLDNLNISHLLPGSTQVFILGTANGDRIVARRIEFWPIEQTD